MAKYLVTYHASTMPHDPEAMAMARDAFMQWAAKTGGALADPGAPVMSAKSLSSDGVKDGPAEEPVNGWSIIEAQDADAALRLLSDHPFLGRGGVPQVHEPVEF